MLGAQEKSTRKTGANVLNLLGHFLKRLTGEGVLL